MGTDHVASAVKSSLLRGLRLVIRADSDPARQVLFANLRDSHVLVRLAFELHERLRGGWASALLVSCYGLAAFAGIDPPQRGARVLLVARHANARRQVSRVGSWIGIDDCAWVRARLVAWSGVLGAARVLFTRDTLRLLRLIRRLDARYGFLVTCRAVATMAWYARRRAILRDDAPGAVLISSDTHPEEVGFVAAARDADIPQVFVSHAYPTPISPPLDFTLSILEGEAALRARREKGPIRSTVLYGGIDGESVPLDPERLARPTPIIGIFPPKAICWPTLRAAIAGCRPRFGARQILIRWHPSTLETPHLTRVVSDLTGVAETRRDASLADVARQCDWVVADENSNVHLQVLKLGVPTVTMRRLGLFPDGRSDQYGFVAGGVIAPAVDSLQEVQPDALMAFFSDCWQTRFREYDGAYLRAEHDVARDVRHAVRGLLEPSRAAASRAS